MAKQHVRKGRLGKQVRQDRALVRETAPAGSAHTRNQTWDPKNRVWVRRV